MKIAVLIPCFLRPEYTEKCLESVFNQEYQDTTFYLVDEGGNEAILRKYARPQDIIIVHESPIGLRNTIIEFFELVKKEEFDYISKIDNDCLVPKNWLHDILSLMESTFLDILSPNTSETQAALKYGKDDTYGFGFRPSNFVGGLWTMRRKLIDNLWFEKTDTSGIRGAFSLLHQIIKLSDPKATIGWTDKVTFEDIGYWGGTHPEHLKTESHAEYSELVGRPIGWTVEAGQ